jgi:formate dehydrogenase subunit gamma
MATGEVDLNWAKEHHDVWLARQLKPDQPGTPAGTLAE